MMPCLLCVPVPVLSHLREKPDGFLVPLGLLAPKSSLSLLFCFAGQPAAPHVPPPTVTLLVLVAKRQGQAGQLRGRMLVLFSLHSSTDETPAKCPRAPTESPDNVLPVFMVRRPPAHAAHQSTYLSTCTCVVLISLGGLLSPSVPAV